MITTLLKHELQNLLKSKRIYLTVLLFLLLFISVFIVRTIDYQKQINQYIEDVRITDSDLHNAINYSFLNPRAIQEPIMFSIFNEGFNYPRVVDIQFYTPITVTFQLNEENNLLYIENKQLDITFLITFFLSLFILLIAYDSINGEKQLGTLRVLMTYPIKRQTFILKKMLGIFIFVAFVFTLPYIIALISLMVIYASLLTINFFLCAFFYWFLVILFILFFSLLGIFISSCTKDPNRALVYSLLVWILFSIVLPISWEYILSPKLYNDKLNILQQNYRDKYLQTYKIQHDDVPEDADIHNVGHILWNGDFYDNTVWGLHYTYDTHYRYQRYMYEVYFPASREAELSIDEIYRKQINIENTKNWIFFFNPIVIFNNLSMKITGNSRNDHLRFLHDSREVRDDLISLGSTEGWLFDYRFFALYKEEHDLNPLWISMVEEFNDDYDLFWDNWDYVWARIVEFREQGEFYEMEIPHFRKYQQPHFTIAMIIPRIYSGMLMLVGSILVLWVLTWNRFMKYDVR